MCPMNSYYIKAATLFPPWFQKNASCPSMPRYIFQVVLQGVVDGPGHRKRSFARIMSKYKVIRIRWCNVSGVPVKLWQEDRSPIWDTCRHTSEYSSAACCIACCRSRASVKLTLGAGFIGKGKPICRNFGQCCSPSFVKVA